MMSWHFAWCLLLILCGSPVQDGSQATETEQAETEPQPVSPPPPTHGIRRDAPPLPSKSGTSSSLYTLDAPPPGFDGKSRMLLRRNAGMSGWSMHDGGTMDWVLDEQGNLHASDRDVVINHEFGDCQLHLEYSLPRTPGRIGSASASSGLQLHERYEIQLANSYGRPPNLVCSGAIKGQSPPLVNATLPAPGWQALDVYFSAPKIKDGVIVQKPRVTALLNGILILNNVEIDGPTSGASGSDMVETGRILLKGSPDPVIFRNIWIRSR